MKRPSFQFYPADWRNNSKLRRCSDAARGAWMDILCVLHDSDEYGICRWPLAELARASGIPLKLAKELASKGVLKGADSGADPYIFTPRHAGKNGQPVKLVEANSGPCWYCSRLVRDEYIRHRRGQSTRFDSTNQPNNEAPKPTPKAGFGERHGDGPTSSSTSSIKPSVPNGTGAEAPGLDPADAIFQVAVPWLTARGVKESSARSLLGGAVKQLGAAEAWNLASECMDEKPIEPSAWLSAALNKRIGRKQTGVNRHGNFSQQDYRAGVAEDGTF